MPQDPSYPGQPEALSAVLAAYLEAVDAGQTPDPQEWLARHPHLADQLRDFLAAQDQIERIAGPLKAGAAPAENAPQGPETMDGRAESGAGAEPVPERIRYFGDYEVHAEIARGGMGVVYRARQVSLNRLVALKMIRAEQLASAQEVRRFRDEAEMAAQLDHPSIVPIYEIGASDGQHYFSMKLIQGGNLHRFLPRYRNDLKAAARLLAAAARAVHHAHQRSLLHRDIKPGNILIDENGQPHITDFGLAKKLEAAAGLTLSGAIVGTPEYMSPEQARGDKLVTTGTDVYGLGAVLYVLLTGQPPFQGGTLRELLNRVVEEAPTPPRTLNPGLDHDLETICLKCLHKDPGRRYGSAQELAEELERWLNGEPIAARPVGRVERVVMWMKRRPAVAGLFFTNMLLVLALAIFGPLIALREADLRRRAETAQHAAAKREEEAIAARKEVERALIDNLLRPLGHREEPPGVFEVEALLELAGLSNDRVRLGFIDKALESQVSAQRLGRRADMAILAAGGLDSAKRQHVLKLLRGKLLTQAADPAIQGACALLAIELEADDPDLIRPAAAHILAEMGQPQSPFALRSLAEKLAAALTRLPPAEARPLAQKAVGVIIAKMEQTPHLFRNGPAVGGLITLAPTLAPKEAVHLLLDQLAQQTDAEVLRDLRAGLAAVVQTLDQKVAAEIGRAILTCMEQPKQPRELTHLTSSFVLVAARMTPKEASRRAQDAAQLILKQLDQTPPKNRALVSSRFAQYLVDVVPLMEPSAAAQMLIARMGKAKDWTTLEALGAALNVLVHRLEPRPAGEIAQIVITQTGRMMAPARPKLLGWLTAVALRMTPDEALALLRVEMEKNKGNGSAAAETLRILTNGVNAVLEKNEPKGRVVLRRLAQIQTFGDLDGLSYGLKEAAKDMAPPEAAEALEVLTNKVGQICTSERGVRLHTGEAFKALAARLTAKDNDQVVQMLLTHIGQQRPLAGKPGDTKAFVFLRFLCGGLKEAAQRMDPRAAAALLLAQMDGIKDSETLVHLAQGIKNASAAIEPSLARQHSTAAVQALAAAWGENVPDRNHQSVAEVLAALAEHMAPEEAAAMLLTRMGGAAHGPGAIRPLALALHKACDRLPPALARDYGDQAGRLLRPKMQKTPELYAGAFHAVAQRMAPEEARLMAAEAAQLILVKLDGKLGYRPALAEALNSVTAILAPQDAQRFANQAALLFLDKMRQAGVKESYERMYLARALKITASTLEPDQARGHLQQALRILAPAMDQAEQENNTLTEAFKVVASAFKPQETAQLLIVQAARANEADPRRREAQRYAHVHLTLELDKVAEKLTKPELVELLKHPLCVGQPRTAILKELSRRTGQAFATLWQFVAWAERHEPALDLRAPLRGPRLEAVSP